MKKVGYISSLLFITTTIVIFWGVNKGLDFTDEGSSILGFMYPGEIYFVRAYQPLILSFMPYQLDLIGYRILRIILTIASAWLFTYGLWNWLRHHFPSLLYFNFIALLSIIGIGAMMSFAMGQRMLAYNYVTLILLQTISGLFFYYMYLSSLNDSNQKIRWTLLLLSGFFSALLFFVKFPTSITIGGIICLGVLVLHHHTQKKLSASLYPLILLSIGCCLGLIYFFGTVNSFSNWYTQFTGGISNIEGHQPTILLQDYFQSFWTGVKKGIIAHFQIPALIGGGLGFWRKKGASKWFFYIAYSLFTIGILWMGYIIYDYNYFKHGDYYKYEAGYIYFLLLFCFILGVFLCFFKEDYKLFRGQRKMMVGTLLYLFLLPFCGSIGTNNNLSMHITKFYFAWLPLFFLLANIIWHRLQFPLLPILMFVMIGVATSQTINGYVFNPYRLDKNLLHQQQSLKNLPISTSLKVDQQTKQCVEGVNSLLQSKTKFQKGDPILALYDLPGLVYLLGGVSPGATWYSRDNPSSFCYKLSTSNLTHLHNTIIIYDNTDPIPDKFKKCMHKYDIDYPNSYQLIGTAFHYQTDDTLSIFAPKSMIHTK